MSVPRWGRKLLIGAAVWQVGVISLALACRLGGVGAREPVLPRNDALLLDSVLAPSDADLAQSVAAVRSLREAHRQFVQVWGEAFAALLEPGPHTEDTPALSRAARNRFALGERAAKIVGAAAAGWPRFYQYQSIPCLTDELVHGEPEDTPGLALARVRTAQYGQVSLEALEKLPGTFGRVGSESWKHYAAFGTVLTHVAQGRYQEAVPLLSDSSWEHRIQPKKQAHEALIRLQEHPQDWTASLRLTEALLELGDRPGFDAALADHCWRLFDRAETPGQQAAILHLLAGIFCRIGWNCDSESAWILRVASIRTAQRLGEPDGATGQRLAELADLEVADGNRLLACFLYREAAAGAGKPGEWGRAVFNHGYLLRVTGYPTQAENVLTRILQSDVDDRDPAPFIMEAYRNYRHRAAEEISRSYVQRLNFPMAWWWARRATFKYPYLSWCGTCMASARSRQTVHLLWTSLLAGPVPFAVNLISSPLRNWFVWAAMIFVGAATWTVLRLARYRRGKKPLKFRPEQPSP